MKPTETKSSGATMHEWDAAYEAFPGYAGSFAWLHVCELYDRFPGNKRVYEVGFGSGANLKWARDRGWEVAGCDVAASAVSGARRLLPGAPLFRESIVDCSAPSEHFDLVVDRAALTYLTPKDLKKAIEQVRRILVPGGVFLFNPYGISQTKPFPDKMPSATLWTKADAERLFPATKWELIDSDQICLHYVDDPPEWIEETLRILVRKLPK
jgi:SAM-dependent methyltransferase